jgi:hypothetical protein
MYCTKKWRGYRFAETGFAAADVFLKQLPFCSMLFAETPRGSALKHVLLKHVFLVFTETSMVGPARDDYRF